MFLLSVCSLIECKLSNDLSSLLSAVLPLLCLNLSLYLCTLVHFSVFWVLAKVTKKWVIYTQTGNDAVANLCIQDTWAWPGGNDVIIKRSVKVGVWVVKILTGAYMY